MTKARVYEILGVTAASVFVASVSGMAAAAVASMLSPEKTGIAVASAVFALGMRALRRKS